MIITVKDWDTDDVGVKIVVTDSRRDVKTYIRAFTRGNPNWTRDMEANIRFIEIQQAYASNVLKYRGYLFLNDVFDMLGFPRTVEGQVVGWIYNAQREAIWFDIRPNTDDVLIGFNTDGCILQYI